MSYLIIVFAFILPISTAATSAVGGLIILLWIIEGDFKNKIREIINNKIAVIVICYIMLHIIALIWTNNMSMAWYMVSKQWKLLLLPVLLNIVRKEHIKYYFNAFILGMAICVLISYLLFFEIINLQQAVILSDPLPFHSHISYNILLCMAICLLIQSCLLENLKKTDLIIYVGLIILMSINVFLNRGRVGYAAFFVMILSVIFLHFKKNLIKGAVTALIIVPIVFFGAYKGSSAFRQRIDDTLYSIKNFERDPYNSVGERLTFFFNSLEVIKNNPVIGVGTGDFPDEYRRINKIKSPALPNTNDPHNQYLLVLAQFGAVGFIIFCLLFYYQFNYAKQFRDNFTYIRFVFPTLYIVVMFGGTFLLAHSTGVLFSLFGAILYKDFKNS